MNIRVFLVKNREPLTISYSTATYNQAYMYTARQVVYQHTKLYMLNSSRKVTIDHHIFHLFTVRHERSVLQYKIPGKIWAGNSFDGHKLHEAQVRYKIHDMLIQVKVLTTEGSYLYRRGYRRRRSAGDAVTKNVAHVYPRPQGQSVTPHPY